ncbi:hypothetical protein IMZ48_03295 [Candidatus Bathyarchaeota archaeon]|nr:hypothetical protein [Candidatus Bathyarchaeota archaeon]
MPGRAFTLILAFATALAQAATCYGVNGVEFPNQIICPGSSACCGEGATCMGNRLCHNPSDEQDEFVRGPCAEDPYDESKCAAICAYSTVLFLGKSLGSVWLTGWCW